MKFLQNFVFFVFFVFFIPSCGDSFLESDCNDSISVFGTICTEDGKSVQGARVLVQDWGVPSTPAVITEMTVDKEGNFFGIIHGVDYAEIRLLIEMEGYTATVYPSKEYLPIVATMGVPMDLGHCGFLQKIAVSVVAKEEL
ncbi:MAG: hypothetical protein V1667_02460 [bacterium]